MNGHYTARDGIKGDCAIEEARRECNNARAKGNEPTAYQRYIANIRTSYELNDLGGMIDYY